MSLPYAGIIRTGSKGPSQPLFFGGTPSERSQSTRPPKRVNPIHDIVYNNLRLDPFRLTVTIRTHYISGE